MWYAMIGEDVPDSLAARLAARPAHLARLQTLEAQGRLLLAGPFPLLDEDAGTSGFSGSLIVADFANLAEANAWAQADPYVAAGVYARVQVKPFKKVFGV